MKMNSFWKMIPVAAFAAFALVACDSGSSSDSDVADSNSSAAAQSSGSSSSGMESGGSVAKSSSSVAVCTNTYGTNTVTDCRDGQVYKTVTIGTQTWMAQNLNYAVDCSWCYNNSADSCSKYGRLYQWTAAMNIASSYLTTSAGAVINAPHQGACPAGWHIPTDAEWNTLATAVGGSDAAGTKLKSTGGWYSSGNGTDSYGFSALHAGSRSINGYFNNAGLYADFWSATEDDAFGAYGRNMNYGTANMFTYYYNKCYAFSVRCVQD